MNDNFNRKHGEILDTAQDLEPVSIRFNPFQSVSIRFNLFQSDLIVKGKHGEIEAQQD